MTARNSVRADSVNSTVQSAGEIEARVHACGPVTVSVSMRALIASSASVACNSAEFRGDPFSRCHRRVAAPLRYPKAGASGERLRPSLPLLPSSENRPLSPGTRCRSRREKTGSPPLALASYRGTGGAGYKRNATVVNSYHRERIIAARSSGRYALCAEHFMLSQELKPGCWSSRVLVSRSTKSRNDSNLVEELSSTFSIHQLHPALHPCPCHVTKPSWP